MATYYPQKEDLSAHELKRVAREFASLRIATAMRHRGAKCSRPFRDSIIETLTEKIPQVSKGSSPFLAMRYVDGRAEASFFVGNARLAGNAPPEHVIYIDFKTLDAVNFRWARGCLKKHAHLFHEGTSIMLDAFYSPLLPAFARLGFPIETILLNGKPKVALRALEKRYGALEWPRHKGLKLRLMRRGDIEDALRLFRHEFTRNPHFGRICATPEYLHNFRAKLYEKIRAKCKCDWVVYDGKRLVGHFAFTRQGSNAFFAGQAGMSLVFDAALQRQGLSKYAYATMLRRMLELKVTQFNGGTAQPGVIRLAKLMKRPLLCYVLRKGEAAFPASHFETRYFRKLTCGAK